MDCVFVTHGPYPARLLCPWDFPGKNTGVGCHSLLQGIFLQELNQGFPHCRQILYSLSHQGRLDLIYQSKDTEWLAGWKQSPNICCLQETDPSSKEKHRLTVDRWKVTLGTGQPKQSRYSSTSCPSRRDRLQAKRVNKGQRQCITIKGTIHQGNKLINICARNIGTVSKTME